MARYYFDVVHENGRIRDDEGLDLPTTDAMRKNVSRVILDLAHDEIGDESHALLQVIVRDDTDFAVFAAALDYSTTWH
jgi:hypothetical protein